MAGELILIVEDSLTVQRQIKIVLDEAGYHTLTADDGKTALDWLRKEPVDVLLTDIRMPDIDGMQLWKRAKQLQPDLLGIFMTAHSSLDTAIKSFYLGISRFLLKPFVGAELLGAVADTIERERMSQENTRLRLLIPFVETRAMLPTETLPIAQTCQPLVEAVGRETLADYAAVFLKTDAEPALLARFAGADAAPFLSDKFPVASLLGRVLEQNRTLSLRHSQQSDGPVPGIITAVPLKWGERDLGALLVGRTRPDQPFTKAERDTFEVVASQLTLLLENQRLQAQLDQRDDRLQKLAGLLITQQAAQNQQLNDRINAEVLPALTSTRKNIQSFLQRARPSSAGDLIQAEERLHSLINGVKKLTQVLRPANLNEFGLSAALRQYVRETGEATPGCPMTFQLEGEEVPRLDTGVELALFRACQQALIGACQHVQTNVPNSPVTLTVRVLGPRNKPDQAEFEIYDPTTSSLLDQLESTQPQQWVSWLTVQEWVRQAEAQARYVVSPDGTHIIISHSLPVLEEPV